MDLKVQNCLQVGGRASYIAVHDLLFDEETADVAVVLRVEIRVTEQLSQADEVLSDFLGDFGEELLVVLGKEFVDFEFGHQLNGVFCLYHKY